MIFRIVFCVSTLAAIYFFALVQLPAAQEISQDRDLIELDLNKWDCLHRAEGTAKNPDTAERNRLKNRLPPESIRGPVKSFDFAGFLNYVGAFDVATKGKRRKDLVPAERQKLEPLEKELVQLTAYLGLAYAGPPESTNCADVDFHDWHLEVFEKPIEHAPQPGDQTPIICEITPRTQNLIYRSGIRIQSLAGFFRRSDLEHESTGHKPQKVRITGYLCWDDEHNGSADVGVTVQRHNPNGYHNPWRKTAWEIHPVIKIEPADGAGPAAPAAAVEQSATPQAIPFPFAAETPTPIPTPTPRRMATVTQPLKIKIPYGETILSPGTRLPIVSEDERTVTVEYLGQKYPLPKTATDLGTAPRQ